MEMFRKLMANTSTAFPSCTDHNRAVNEMYGLIIATTR